MKTATMKITPLADIAVHAVHRPAGLPFDCAEADALRLIADGRARRTPETAAAAEPVEVAAVAPAVETAAPRKAPRAKREV